MPATPATTPNSLRPVTGSCRVTAQVIRKVKIGEVEFRIAARPASRLVSAQAIMVKGMTLFITAWKPNSRQVRPSVGMGMPRSRSTSSSTAPAITVRAAISVTGGMVATPSLMKV